MRLSRLDARSRGVFRQITGLCNLSPSFRSHCNSKRMDGVLAVDRCGSEVVVVLGNGVAAPLRPCQNFCSGANNNFPPILILTLTTI